MRIIDDTKLDFDDVLISPKRSQLTSRKDAELTRKFTFKHSQHTWSGVPKCTTFVKVNRQLNEVYL